ncbi:centromere protein H (CENP-H)-domain-containing protein [Triangularia verruculosa]|uniref:Centromere protein H (CENP-H)-domain-containing protein n=1 Tax=Triangularia verruculosa TaxID=2587418 RepID=A0AAN6XF80_9PEZI|nr:centromere protein H (CENP-H)-domain-containing protein [Triangularia verruculosa]
MATRNVTTSLPQFSQAEAGVLELYDKVQQLQLQLAALRAREHHTQEVKAPADGQARLLEAKASLSLRDSVVESVVIVQPILKAVHHATHASPIERDLLSHIEQRDHTAKRIADHYSALHAANESLAKVEVECLQTKHYNVELASQTLRLAAESIGQEPASVENEQLRYELDLLETQLKARRQKWRVMKGTASAIVAGSGVDWARDGRLRELVLDTDD